MMEKTLSKNISVLGFVMTGFMVFYHSGYLDNSYAINELDGVLNIFLSGIFDTMGKLGMCWFFTVTGFLLFRDLSFENYLDKMKRRVFSLLLPYVVWQLIYLLRAVCVGSYTGDFLYRTFAFVYWPYGGALWYIYAVFLLALLSPAMLLFSNKWLCGGGIATAVICITAATAYNQEPVSTVINYGLMPNLLYYLPCYLIGAFYGRFYQDLKEKESLQFVTMLLLLALLLNGIDGALFWNTSIKMLPILILATLPCVYQGEFKLKRISFLVYATHVMVVQSIKPYIDWLFVWVRNYFGLPVWVYNGVGAVLVLAITILLSLLIDTLFRRFLPKGLKFLTGGRG